MNSSNVSARSRGILAFASNTSNIDYETIAQLSLKLAQHHLDVPVKLIVPNSPTTWHNVRQDVDTQQPTQWNNFGRYSAFDHSPWDETIVIDADYLVLTDRLNCLWNSSSSLLLCKQNSFIKETTVPMHGIDPVWATVFYFQKNYRTEMFFDLVARVQRNWNYYKSLFGLYNLPFRNDYAFAIAAQVLHGYSFPSHLCLPFNISTVEYAIEKIQVNSEWLVVRDHESAVILPRQDIHVMSKTWLSNHLKEFVQEAMS